MSSSPADAFITFNFLNISKHIFGSNVVKFGESILIMISTLLLIDVSYHLLKKAWRSLSFHDFKKTVVTRIWPNFRLPLPFFSDNFKENTHTCLKRPVEINVRGEILDFFIDMPSLSTIFQDFWQRFGKCDIFFSFEVPHNFSVSSLQVLSCRYNSKSL